LFSSPRQHFIFDAAAFSRLIKGKRRVELARPGKMAPIDDILRVLKKFNLLPGRLLS